MSDMAKLSFQYVRIDLPETLLEFLARRFRYHTAVEWESLVKKAFVKVDGKKVKPGHLLETRQKIVYERPPIPEPEVDPSFKVIFEDRHILAVSKSGNIPTSPSGKYWNNCLVHLLQREFRLDTLHAVHRLDRETSGINLFSKSKESARLLGADFQQGRVRKEYSAILEGRLAFREVFVSAPLADEHSGAIRIKQTVQSQGRESRTIFRLKAVLPKASLVQATPLTGRTHQIRAHAAYIGHPVVSDKLYGVSEEDFIRWVSDENRSYRQRQLLHATTLSFTHPFTKKPLTLRAPDGVLMDIFLNG